MSETPAAVGDWLAPVVLENAWIRLEPLSLSHVPELAEVADDPEIWRWLPVVAPKGDAKVRALVQSGIGDYQRGERIPFAVVRGGIAVGTTSYLDLSPENRSVEIGWTWYGRSARRTATNTASKRLLLEHAFDVFQVRRVASKPMPGTSPRTWRWVGLAQRTKERSDLIAYCLTAVEGTPPTTRYSIRSGQASEETSTRCSADSARNSPRVSVKLGAVLPFPRYLGP
jgi:RimJ/RimL family protein N-acetyltransferase